MNYTILTYLAIHGSYGFMWILKSKIFPDKSWNRKVSLIYGLYTWLGLSLYWISPLIIVTGYFNNGIPVEVNPILLAISISFFSFGVFFHFTSDMQKHSIINIKNNVLINDGLFYNEQKTSYINIIFYFSFIL